MLGKNSGDHASPCVNLRTIRNEQTAKQAGQISLSSVSDTYCVPPNPNPNHQPPPL